VWRGCAAQLALWTSVAAIFFWYARSLGRVGPDLWMYSIVCGLVASMALVVAGSAMRTLRETRMLSRAPHDGAWVAVSGEIRCSSPLRAPISGELVAAYEYSISRDERIGKSTSPVNYFDGKALAPCAVVTAFGEVRILTVPMLEVEPAAVADERALTNARDHVRRAAFERRDTAHQRTSALEREWTDDDGSFRIDKRYSAADVDLADRFRFEERHIRPRDMVCAIGVYSAERRALIPDARWGQTSRMIRGSAAEVSRALRARVIRM
jgi:hypothetical protein